MTPSPTQLLSYFAGRTKRITLGTAVIVLPWHDPVRVAEEIALLDILSGGRCLFGFGRGAASVEYAGFRMPMEEARPRFVEAAKIIVKALTNEAFDWEGEYFKIPRRRSSASDLAPERRFYASSVSPESAEIMAKLGFGMLVVMQNEWPKAAEDIDRYRRDRIERGSRAAAADHPHQRVGAQRAGTRRRSARCATSARKWDSIDRHYHFSDGHLASREGL